MVQEQPEVITAPQIRGVQVNGIVMLTAGVTRNGTLLTVDGVDYMVGPALYKLSAPQEDYQSVLGTPPAEILAGKHSVDYVPSTEWPQGIMLDNAVVCAFGPPEQAQ